MIAATNISFLKSLGWFQNFMPPFWHLAITFSVTIFDPFLCIGLSPLVVFHLL